MWTSGGLTIEGYTLWSLLLLGSVKEVRCGKVWQGGRTGVVTFREGARVSGRCNEAKYQNPL